MKIGGALKFNRQLSGLTLDSLAKNLNSIYDDENFTKSKLSKWERDIEQPTLTSIKKVADYFGCTLDSMIEMSKDDEEKRNEIRFNRYSETLREVGFDVEKVDGKVAIFENGNFLDNMTYDEFVNTRPQDVLNKVEIVSATHSYCYFDSSISAGQLESVNPCTHASDYIEISDSIMGVYAGSSDVILLKVNGDSMNKVIPNRSLIVVDTSRKKTYDISNNDIVVFANNNEYSVKRYINDKVNERFIFRPESTDSIFADIIITYENSSDLKLIGKVVKYIVDLD